MTTQTLRQDPGLLRLESGPRMLHRLREIRSTLGPFAQPGVLRRVTEALLLGASHESPQACLDVLFQMEPTLDAADEHVLLLVACHDHVDDMLLRLRGARQEDVAASQRYMRGLLSGFYGMRIRLPDGAAGARSEWTEQTLQSMEDLGYIHGTSIREQKEAREPHLCARSGAPLP